MKKVISLLVLSFVLSACGKGSELDDLTGNGKSKDEQKLRNYNPDQCPEMNGKWKAKGVIKFFAMERVNRDTWHFYRGSRESEPFVIDGQEHKAEGIFGTYAITCEDNSIIMIYIDDSGEWDHTRTYRLNRNGTLAYIYNSEKYPESNEKINYTPVE